MKSDKIINAGKLKELIINKFCFNCHCSNCSRKNNNDNCQCIKGCEINDIFDIIDNFPIIKSLKFERNYDEDKSKKNLFLLHVEHTDGEESPSYSTLQVVELNTQGYYTKDTTDYTPTSSSPVEKIEKKEEGSDLYE